MDMSNIISKLIGKEKVELSDWATVMSDELLSKFNSALAEAANFEKFIKGMTAELKEEYAKALKNYVDSEIQRFKQDNMVDQISAKLREEALKMFQERENEALNEFNTVVKQKMEKTIKEAEELTKEAEEAMEKVRETIMHLKAKSDAAVKAMKFVEEKLKNVPLMPKTCSCGRVNLPHAKYCDSCGAELQ